MAVDTTGAFIKAGGEKAEREAAPAQTTPAAGRKLTALVVDDDPLIRRVLSACLQNQNIAVAEAGNGIECLRLVATTHFDVIFMDIVMPEKDGLETIIELRKQGHTCRIIAITAHEKLGDKMLLDAARAFGADDAIKKPFDPVALVKNVKAVLSAAVT